MTYTPRTTLVLGAPALLALAALFSCKKAADEPTGSTATAAPVSTIAPLVWDVPPGWTRVQTPSANSGVKAGYRVSPTGEDKEEAEVGVYFFGTGSKGDPAQAFKAWFDQFDGKVGDTAVRESFEAHGLKVETVEVMGTYKVPLTSTPHGRRAPPVQAVKAHFRLYGGVVKTTDRGNWFFRMVGPDDTVQASRSQLRAMMESAR
jgi:hypothetical protein